MMIKTLVLVAYWAGNIITATVDIPKENIQAFYNITKHYSTDKGDKRLKFTTKCLIVFNKEFTDKDNNIYERSHLYSSETCDSLNMRFYK